jgi:uncharacterized phage protein gp47/JayE
MGDLPTRADFFSVGRKSIAITSGLRINPRVVDIPGSDLNIILGAMSLMSEETIAALAVCLQGSFIETASGDQLDRVAFDRFGLARLAATPATVDLTLTRPAAGPAGTYPAGSRVQTPTGAQFATNTDAVFAGATLTVAVSATALIAGPENNVAAGLVTQFLDAPFDPTLTVTNAAGAAGGAEAEDDIAFRGRLRQFFPTIRRGVIGAIEFGAIQVPGVAVARAIEVENGGTGLPAAAVSLFVADSNGLSTATMVQAVVDALIEFRAAGIPVLVTGGALAPPIPITWRLGFETGVNQVEVQEQIRAVSIAVAQFLRPGETLYRSALIAAARTVLGAIINDGSLVSPFGDVTPFPGNLVIRVQNADVTFVT